MEKDHNLKKIRVAESRNGGVTLGWVRLYVIVRLTIWLLLGAVKVFGVGFVRINEGKVCCYRGKRCVFVILRGRYWAMVYFIGINAGRIYVFFWLKQKRGRHLIWNFSRRSSICGWRRFCCLDFHGSINYLLHVLFLLSFAPLCLLLWE
jgi:hypothetical protein